MVVVLLILLVLIRFWAGITPMVRWRLRLRAGSGGALRLIMVLGVTAWVTMVVTYIPATVAATLGSTCGALVKKRL